MDALNKKYEVKQFSFSVPDIFAGLTEEEIKKRDELIAKQELEQEIKSRENAFKYCGLGELYQENDLQKFQIKYPMQETMLNSARTFFARVKSGQVANMVLLGNSGTGKTTLASGLMKELNRTVKNCDYGFNNYFSVYYITSKDLCDIMQKTKSFTYGKSWDKILNEFAFYDVFVIDEIGKATDKFEFEVLFAILDKRMQYRKSNILISNLDYNSFTLNMSDYGMSRLNINGSLQLLKVEGIPDLRQEKKEVLK